LSSSQVATGSKVSKSSKPTGVHGILELLVLPADHLQPPEKLRLLQVLVRRNTG